MAAAGVLDAKFTQDVAATGRSRLSDIVLMDLVREIVGARWSTGDAIPSEPELVARYGFSKVVVRESIRALATLGFAKVQQGKRTLVMDESEWDVHSPVVQTAYRLEGRARELLDALFEARLAIEPAMAALCAQRASAAEHDALAETVAELQRAIDEDDRRLYRVSDGAFHALIGKASGNLSLRAILTDLMRYVETLGVGEAYGSEEIATMTALHAAMAQRIAAHDADGARDACAESVRYVHRTMRLHL
jgi:DNA-binding FadR family transcriptional regulator